MDTAILFLLLLFSPTLGYLDINSPSNYTGLIFQNSWSIYDDGTVAGGFDINGDNIADFAVNSKDATVFIIFGSSTLTGFNLGATASLSGTGKGFMIKAKTSSPSQSVSFVTRAGDVNGDKVDDIIFTSYNAVSGGDGIAYVIYGSKTQGFLIDLDLNSISTLTTNTRGFAIKGPAGSGYYGISAASGDFNGDKISDVLIGAFFSYSGTGSAYVIYGSATAGALIDMDLSSIPSLTTGNKGFEVKGGISNFNFAMSVSSGDINGDKIDDLILGGREVSGGPAGMVSVIFGSNITGTLTDMNIGSISSLNTGNKGFQIKGKSGSKFGQWVSVAGDLNKDGIQDIIVGACSEATNGAAYMFYGSTITGALTDINLATSGSVYSLNRGFRIGGSTLDYFGFSVAGIGDFNQDGVDDAIISAGYSTVFAAVIIYGNSSKALLTDIDFTTTPDINLTNRGIEMRTTNSSYKRPIVGLAGKIYGDQKQNFLLKLNYYVVAISAFNNGIPPIPPPPPIPNTPVTPTVPTKPAPFEPPAIIKALVQSLAQGNQASPVAAIAASIFAFANAGPVILIASSEMFDCLKYLELNYPPRLKFVLEYKLDDIISLPNLLAPPEPVSNEVISYPLSHKFEEAGFSSSFLLNFWPSFITLVGILLIGLIVTLFKPCRRKKSHSSLQKALIWVYSQFRRMIKWNLFLSTFTGSYGDISLFTSFEMKTAHFSSALEWTSFVLCILLNLFVLLIQTKLLHVTYKLNKAKIQSEKAKDSRILKDAKKQLQDYEIVFENFSEASMLHQSFVFLYNLKIYLFYTSIAYFNEVPLVPSLFSLAIGLLMLIYLLAARPLKAKAELIQFVCAEIIFEVMTLSVVAIAINDKYDLGWEDEVVVFGDIIIACNFLFMIVIAVFLLFQVFSILISLYRLCKGRSNSSNKEVLKIKAIRPQRENIDTSLATTTHVVNLNNSQILDLNMSYPEIDSTMIASPLARRPRLRGIGSHHAIRHPVNFRLELERKNQQKTSTGQARALGANKDIMQKEKDRLSKKPRKPSPTRKNKKKE